MQYVALGIEMNLDQSVRAHSFDQIGIMILLNVRHLQQVLITARSPQYLSY